MARDFRRFAVLSLAAGALALAFAGCNSGPSSSSNPACTLPAGAQIALVYPAPGSTGNLSLLPQVVVASTATLPSSYDILLTYLPSAIYGSGQYGGYVTAVTPPFPTPNATPSFSNPIYYSSAFNTSQQQLPPGQSITVSYNDINSTCNPTAFANFGT